MAAPLPFGGAANARSPRGTAVHAQGRLSEGYKELRDGGRRWAPRSTLLLATGVSSVFWIVVGWLIVSNL